MSDTAFTLDDLMRILREGSGETEEPAGDPAGVEFADLGYDSLALLETAGRIEREYGLTLDESALAEATTPRALVELVNEHLARVRA
ncbi:acyl carrier protein [Amycolatopsis sp. cmx-4-83]|uniref:acyl carrier protein n=1 Tax=Amycolatopsis sp. cmx-4-83 TaxID=2790940 RepID=UPI00397A9A9F